MKDSTTFQTQEIPVFYSYNVRLGPNLVEKPAVRQPEKRKRRATFNVLRNFLVAPLLFLFALISLTAAVSAIVYDRTLPKAVEWFDQELITGVREGRHVHHIIMEGVGFDVDCPKTENKPSDVHVVDDLVAVKGKQIDDISIDEPA